MSTLKWKIQVATLFVFTVTAPEAAATKGEDEATQASRTICHELQYNTVLANKLQTAVNSAYRAAATEADLAAAHRLAALYSSDSNKQLGHQALAAIAESYARTKIKAAEEADAKITPAIIALRDRAARLYVLRQKPMQGTARPASSSYCDAHLGQITAANVKPEQLGKVRPTADAVFKKQTITVSAQSQGTEGPYSSASSTQGYCTETNTAADSATNILGATLTIGEATVTLATQPLFDDTEKRDKCKK
ncbi:uncharacterized protein TEOVI_000050000 [Trypanosoma equiperdum]|uniref:Trypanosome variant surface glycoprotein (A-type) n=1 Tax=Trypanosoma equiperdum TaxID=5694 RepID=A0A1G4I8A9_TRYEQ|nr:hypothetical protein, conserved [Trypanosoma equiperdum]